MRQEEATHDNVRQSRRELVDVKNNAQQDDQKHRDVDKNSTNQRVTNQPHNIDDAERWSSRGRTQLRYTQAVDNKPAGPARVQRFVRFRPRKLRVS